MRLVAVLEKIQNRLQVLAHLGNFIRELLQPLLALAGKLGEAVFKALHAALQCSHAEHSTGGCQLAQVPRLTANLGKYKFSAIRTWHQGTAG